MSYFHRSDITISAGTAGPGSAFGSVTGGRIHSIRFTNDATVPLSTVRLITVSRNTSGDMICKFMASSSSLTYFPRKSVHNSTGAVLNSTVLVEQMPLVSEVIKVQVTQSSSKGSITGVVSVYIEGNGYN
jgi:hypothetical protein